MSLIFNHAHYAHPPEPTKTQDLLLETRLNLLAREYGYRYRLDVLPISGRGRIEFVRTLREARFIGVPIRQTGGTVKFYKIETDGSLKRHSW